MRARFAPVYLRALNVEPSLSFTPRSRPPPPHPCAGLPARRVLRGSGIDDDLAGDERETRACAPTRPTCALELELEAPAFWAAHSISLGPSPSLLRSQGRRGPPRVARSPGSPSARSPHQLSRRLLGRSREKKGVWRGHVYLQQILAERAYAGAGAQPEIIWHRASERSLFYYRVREAKKENRRNVGRQAGWQAGNGCREALGGARAMTQRRPRPAAAARGRP